MSCLCYSSHNYSKEELREIVTRTIASAVEFHGCPNESLLCRMWMTAGRGNFSIFTSGLQRAELYLIVQRYSLHEEDSNGVPEVMVSMPTKGVFLSSMKSNNYLV